MKNSFKRGFSLFLVLLFVFGVMPFSKIFDGFSIRASAATSFKPGWPLRDSYYITALDAYYNDTNGPSHNGIDVWPDGHSGQYVYSIADGGYVETAGWHNSFGYHVKLRYEVGDEVYHAIFAHMQKGSLLVKQGDTVNSNTKLGKMGATGEVYGNNPEHLHFAIYKGNKYDNNKRTFDYYLNNYNVLSKVSIHTGVAAYSTLYGNWIKSNFEVKNGRYYLQPNKVFNVVSACDLYIQTNDTYVRVRDGYYQEKTVVHKIPQKGTLLHAKAYVVNEKGNIWYQLDGEYKDENGNDYNGKWIWSGRVEPLSQYSVKYDSNGGGGAPASQRKLQGRNITISGVSPSRKGCNFVGWTTKKHSVFNDVDEAVSKITYYPGDNYSANKNITLYAVWVNAATTVTLSKTNVSLCLDDSTKTTVLDADITGAVNANYSIAVSSSSTTNTATTKVTASASDLQIKITNRSGKGKATITLTGKEIGNEILYVIIRDSTDKIVARTSMAVKVTKKYNITYDAAGGSGAPSTQTKISDETAYISTSVPTRANYAFLGWKTPSSGDDAVYGPGDMYKDNADLKLTAKWGPDYYIGSYTEDSGKTLVIFGHGDMPCYGKNNYSASDWYGKCDHNKVEKIRFEASDGGEITSIGSYAFANFTALKTIDIPWTVTRIYSYAFYGCTHLETVTVRSNIKTGSYAFSNCSTLKSFVFNSNRSTAKGMSSGSSVEDEKGTVGAFTFENCVNLQSVDLSTVSSVGESAFSGCSSLNDVTLSENLTNIEDCTFYNCTNLESVDIPDSVTEISDGAFSGCSSLDEIEIPESVETLGDEVFSGCSSITEIEIPETCDNIGSGVFSNCTSLESVDLPEDTAFIPDAMFSGCSSLQSIDLPDSTLDLGDGTFFGCSSLESIDIPENVCDIGSNTFAYCSSLTAVDIPESAAFVDSFAFAGCSNLSSVELSSLTTGINYCAFADCESLESMDFPESLTTIGIAAFSNCTSLATVNFADSYITIEDEAFAGCTALSDVVIPENAQYVSSSAFADCSSNLSVSCYSTSENYEEIAGNIGTYNTIYPVESISITNEAIELTKGQTCQLNVSFTPSNATNKGLTWRSENEEVATVSDNGLVTAVGSGFATIVATSNDRNRQAQYEVICNIPSEEIVMLGDYSNCYVGEEVDMLYSMTPTNPTDIEMVFTSSNENVATVSNSGRLSIVGAGSSLITLSSADGNATTSFTVNAIEYIPASNAELSNNLIELLVDQSYQISGTVTPRDSTNKNMFYYSEDEDIATVDQEGTITAVSVGTTNIVLSVNEGETTAVCAVTVTTDEDDYPFSWEDGEYSGEIVITGCDQSTTGTVVIPGEIDGKTVTEIGAHAFENCIGITEVDLPETVRKLGEYSFAGCTALQQINMPESLEYIGDHAFEGCSNLGGVVLPDEYTLTYNANGGAGAPAAQTGNGTIALSNSKPTREGYTFLGWSTDKSALTASFTAGQIFDLSKDTTLYAVWKQDTPIQPTEYTLTYDANDGTGAPAAQTGNGMITLSSIKPTREGYAFLGWSDVKTATTAQYQPGVSFNLTENTTLYAVWEKNDTPPVGNNPSVEIKNYTSTKAVDYKTTITFTAVVTDAPADAVVHWFIDGRDVGTGETYTKDKATASYTVRCKLMQGSTVLAESEAETVKVNTGFFAKLIAFFKGLFGSLPVITQAIKETL